MRTIETEVEIHADPAKIWQVFSKFGAYPDWQTMFTFHEPPSKPGDNFKVHIAPSPGSGMTFTPQLLALEEERELRWRGKLLGSNFLFVGEHYFRLESKGPGVTTFRHGELFNGLLVTLAPGLLKDTEAAFMKFNADLKEQVERNVST